MRKVLVTAGASGIGKEIAGAFLAAGDSVYTCDINQAALDAAARELADVASQLGGIDILVNNAGARQAAASPLLGPR